MNIHRLALAAAGALVLAGTAAAVPSLASSAPAAHVTAAHATVIVRHHHRTPVAPVRIYPGTPNVPSSAAPAPPTPEPAVTDPGFQGGSFNTHPAPPVTTPAPEPAVTLPGFNGGSHY